MIEQIDTVLSTNKIYWFNYGFTDTDITNINKTYQMYKTFLETYIIRIPAVHNNDAIYKIHIYMNLSKYIHPNDLQQFGFERAKQLIDKIKEITNLPYMDALKQYRENRKFITTENELMTSVMTCILTLYEKSKEIFPPSIKILETHKIKIKNTPMLKSKWSSIGKASGRYFFINSLNLNKYTKESLMNLCAHDTIPGHITFKNNTNKILDKYFKIKKKQNIKIDKNIKKLMKTGTKFLHEGISCYAETIMKDLYDNVLDMYFNQLFRAIKIIIDTGLHSNLVEYKYTIPS
jgi:uncharacterized protein (DUF885 family)